LILLHIIIKFFILISLHTLHLHGFTLFITQYYSLQSHVIQPCFFTYNTNITLPLYIHYIPCHYTLLHIILPLPLLAITIISYHLSIIHSHYSIITSFSLLLLHISLYTFIITFYILITTHITHFTILLSLISLAIIHIVITFTIHISYVFYYYFHHIRSLPLLLQPLAMHNITHYYLHYYILFSYTHTHMSLAITIGFYLQLHTNTYITPYILLLLHILFITLLFFINTPHFITTT